MGVSELGFALEFYFIIDQLASFRLFKSLDDSLDFTVNSNPMVVVSVRGSAFSSTGSYSTGRCLIIITIGGWHYVAFYLMRRSLSTYFGELYAGLQSISSGSGNHAAITSLTLRFGGTLNGRLSLFRLYNGPLSY